MRTAIDTKEITIFTRELGRFPLFYSQRYTAAEIASTFTSREQLALSAGQVITRTVGNATCEWVSGDALAALAFKTQPAKEF